jgi:hypothetical protein
LVKAWTGAGSREQGGEAGHEARDLGACRAPAVRKAMDTIWHLAFLREALAHGIAWRIRLPVRCRGNGC